MSTANLRDLSKKWLLSTIQTSYHPSDSCRDDHGRLPLHWAAASEHADLVDMLLSASRAAAEKPSVAEDGTNLAPPFDGKPITEVRVRATLI